MSDLAGYLNISYSNSYYFTNACNNDMLIYPETSNQKIHLGITSNAQSIIVINSNNTTINNSLNITGATTLSNSLITTGGTTTHSNAVNISGPMTLCNTLNTSGGTTTLSNAVNVYGLSSLCNDVNIAGALGFGTTCATKSSGNSTIFINASSNGALGIRADAAVYLSALHPDIFNRADNYGLPGTASNAKPLVLYGSNITFDSRFSPNIFTNTVNVSGDISSTATMRSVTHSNSGNMQVGGSIISAGNVGIGTTAPAYKLDVNGSTNITNCYKFQGTSVYGTFVNRRYAYVGWLDVLTGLVRIILNAGGYIAGEGRCFLDIVFNARTGCLKGNVSNENNATGSGIVITKETSSGNYWIYLTGYQFFRYSLEIQVVEAGYMNNSITWSPDVPWVPSGQTSFFDSTSHTANNAVSSSIYMTTSNTPVNALTVLNNGNVGIGTTSPNYKLDVNGTLNLSRSDGNSPNVIFSGYSSGTGFAIAPNVSGGNYNSLTSDGDTIMYFNSNNTANPTNNLVIGPWADSVAGKGLVISGSTGYVGIGKKSPAYTLDVAGDIRSFANTGGSNGYLSYSGTTHLNSLTRCSNQASLSSWAGHLFHINSKTGPATGTLAMSILDNGNVGIGTAAPAGRLHLANPTCPLSNNIVFEVGTTSDGGNQGWSAINWNGYISSSHTRINNTKNTWRMIVDQRGTTDSFMIDSFNGTSYKNPLTILTSGNVGIGTTSPAYTLDVAGDARIQGALSKASGTTAVVNANVTTSTGYTLSSGEVGIMSFIGNGDANSAINGSTTPATSYMGTYLIGGVTGGFCSTATGSFGADNIGIPKVTVNKDTGLVSIYNNTGKAQSYNWSYIRNI